MVEYVEYTAIGRYFKVYRDGEYVSQHTTEREACQKAANLVLEFPEAEVRYVHEYEVVVALTDAGLTIAGTKGEQVNNPPVIGSTPNVQFVQGTPGTYDFNQNFTDDGGPDAVTTSLSNTPLTNGLAHNDSTHVLSYDGAGGASVSQHELHVNDHVNPVTISDTFTIEIVGTPEEQGFIVPNQQFTDGAGDQFKDLRQYYLGEIPAGEEFTGYALNPASPSFPAARGLSLDETNEELDFDDASGSAGMVSGVIIDVTTTPIPPSGDAEQDWANRIAEVGVVWYHDFRSNAEVDQFRWANNRGNDPLDLERPNTVRRITTDGITGGGCMEILRSDGSSEPADWWRVFSPMRSPGNGRTTDDPGANGDIPLETWEPIEGGSQTAFWELGNYGPASTGSWEGNEFWLQLRMKLDPRRRDSGMHAGKIMYITRNERSLNAQELVTHYQNSSHFSIYEGLAFEDIENNIGDVLLTWNQWDTYLYHVVAGDEEVANTTIEVWRAQPGETSYTKIFETFNEDIDYQDTWKKAWSAINLNSYHNGANLPEFWIRYDQIIFSHNTIPVPTV